MRETLCGKEFTNCLERGAEAGLAQLVNGTWPLGSTRFGDFPDAKEGVDNQSAP